MSTPIVVMFLLPFLTHLVARSLMSSTLTRVLSAGCSIGFSLIGFIMSSFMVLNEAISHGEHHKGLLVSYWLALMLLTVLNGKFILNQFGKDKPSDP